MSVLFCSDLHLGHDMATVLRGHKSVAEHNHEIITTLNAQCNKRTVLWILGDVAMKEESVLLVRDIPGRKILVRGNHDIYPMSVYLMAGFEQIYGMAKYKGMWITHCPIHPQEMYSRTANVHGHIHYTAKIKQPAFPFINLNWDFWRRAVSLDEIKAIVEAGRVTYDFHDDKTEKNA